MSIKIKIKKRDRDYGLFTWGKYEDFDIITLFEKKDDLTFIVANKEPKRKKVSYKYRRFTLGKKLLNEYKSAKYFIIKKNKNIIKIDFE